MKSFKMLFAGAAILLAGGLLVSMTVPTPVPQEPWEVPEKYVTMENPVEADAQSIRTGQMLYKRHCASCHGREGKGDGPKARTIDTFPGDFSGEAYQNQTDGEHFYKTKFGRDEMPAYEGKIPDEDIWHMVNYMRTFDD